MSDLQGHSPTACLFKCDSRCRLGSDSCGCKKRCIRLGSRCRMGKCTFKREQMPPRGGQDGNAAFCQTILDTCYYYIATYDTPLDFHRTCLHNRCHHHRTSVQGYIDALLYCHRLCSRSYIHLLQLMITFYDAVLYKN